MGCLSGEGLSFWTTIPVPCGVIHLIVHTQNNGSNFSPILIQRSVKQRPVWIYYYSPSELGVPVVTVCRDASNRRT